MCVKNPFKSRNNTTGYQNVEQLVFWILKQHSTMKARDVFFPELIHDNRMT